MSSRPRLKVLCLLHMPLLVLTLFPRHLFAHRPVFTEDVAQSAETAIPITQPHISQVVYREIAAESPMIWLSFDVPENFELYIQIGVPVLEQLKDFRPEIALIGPDLPNSDLPNSDLPFAIPENNGARVFVTKTASPRFFNEHFTGTQSWILRTETIPLKKAGRYYLVAYSPGQETGKVWLSLGRKESFSVDDWRQFPTWRKLIREFHEVD